ncbi:hypothetical protein Droror1_Dr00016290 [Drosera rotundifolia]
MGLHRSFVILIAARTLRGVAILFSATQHSGHRATGSRSGPLSKQVGIAAGLLLAVLLSAKVGPPSHLVCFVQTGLVAELVADEGNTRKKDSGNPPRARVAVLSCC